MEDPHLNRRVSTSSLKSMQADCQSTGWHQCLDPSCTQQSERAHFRPSSMLFLVFLVSKLNTVESCCCLFCFLLYLQIAHALTMNAMLFILFLDSEIFYVTNKTLCASIEKRISGVVCPESKFFRI